MRLTRRSLVIGATLCGASAVAQDRLEPYFIRRSPLWKDIDLAKGESPFAFGMKEPEIARLIDSVVVAVNAPRLRLQSMPSREVADIGKMVAAAVERVCTTSSVPVNGFSRKWLLAEGACEWTRSNLRYDHAWEKRLGELGGWGKLSRDELTARTTSGPILSGEPPQAVCWGLAVTTRDIARAAGLTCDFTAGTYRGLGAPAPKERNNHGTVCFVIDGVEVPADVSSSICDYQNNRKPFFRKKTNSHFVLPRYAEAWEIFLASFNSDIGDAQISGDQQNRHKFVTMTFEEWAARDTTYLKPLAERYGHWQERRT